jgi:hypothetical protein
MPKITRPGTSAGQAMPGIGKTLGTFVRDVAQRPDRGAARHKPSSSALIYQHVTRGSDNAIAQGLGRLLDVARYDQLIWLIWPARSSRGRND